MRPGLPGHALWNCRPGTALQAVRAYRTLGSQPLRHSSYRKYFSLAARTARIRICSGFQVDCLCRAGIFFAETPANFIDPTGFATRNGAAGLDGQSESLDLLLGGRSGDLDQRSQSIRFEARPGPQEGFLPVGPKPLAEHACPAGHVVSPGGRHATGGPDRSAFAVSNPRKISRLAREFRVARQPVQLGALRRLSNLEATSDSARLHRRALCFAERAPIRRLSQGCRSPAGIRGICRLARFFGSCAAGCQARPLPEANRLSLSQP